LEKEKDLTNIIASAEHMDIAREKAVE